MRKGFTLIELLIVITIIGVLSAVAVPSYAIHIERVRASEAIGLLKSLFAAQKRYQVDNGVYASALSDLDITIPVSPNFNAPIVYNSGAPLASIDRRTDGGGNFYTLTISETDEIGCTDEGAPAVGCGQLGSIVDVVH